MIDQKIRPQEPAISCHQVTVQVGGKRGKAILKALDFQAHGGEIIGICGPNGAGKSTFLRALGGLIQPQSGSILVDGQPLEHIRPRQLARQLSFLPQDTQVPFDFPSRDIVLMGRHPYASSLAAWSSEDLAIARQAMVDAECADLADQLVTTLSGGERQRVMIARLLAQDTPIVLLDEMTANQDIRHASLLLDLAKQLAAAGKLVVMVLHDINHAAKYSRRIAVLCRGVLEALGTPGEVITPALLEKVFRVHADVDVATYERPNCVITGLAHTL